MAKTSFLQRKQTPIAALAIGAIVVHLVLRFGRGGVGDGGKLAAVGGARAGRRAAGVGPVGEAVSPRVRLRSAGRHLDRHVGAAWTSIWPATLVVLMLSGGEALEAYAVRSASSVLEALAKRMPSIAHRKQDSTIADVPLAEVARRRRACSCSRTRSARSTARSSKGTA